MDFTVHVLRDHDVDTHATKTCKTHLLMPDLLGMVRRFAPRYKEVITAALPHLISEISHARAPDKIFVSYLRLGMPG